MARLISVVSIIVSVLIQIAQSSALHALGTKGRLGIFGGHTVSIEDVPYMVALLELEGDRVVNLCGGSIIHERFILSAAHCAENVASPSSFMVEVGSEHWTNWGTLIKVEKICCHERYKHGSTIGYWNDICLFKLEEPVPIGPKVKLIKLPDEDLELKHGTLVNASGYGRTEEGLPRQDALRQVTVPIIAQGLCGRYYVDFTDNMICAGSVGHSSCAGDSGGPLTYGDKLVGVESGSPIINGTRQCGTKKGNLYTRVTSYLEWINTTITNNLGSGHILVSQN